MPRSNGTQTRSFVYSGNLLMSATNPENGTVSYTYGSNGKVATRTDAKGQATKYTYDSYARLSKVQRYPSGLNNSPDACQEEDYYYDGTSPGNGATLPQAMGHLSAVQYMGGHNPNTYPTCDTTFLETYLYGTQASPSAAPTAKWLSTTRTLQWNGVGWGPYSVLLTGTFTYDNEGRITSETYPTDVNGSIANLSYAFDQMGRLNTMTDNLASQQIIAGASYDRPMS
jgi:YD repeat-containing protein